MRYRFSQGKKMKFNSHIISSLLALFFCSCLFTLAFMDARVVTATRVFRVGGDFGWQQPGANETSVYSLWAARNRFQAGDSLSFEYKNDSVLEVDKWGYYHCDSNRPIAAFNNGKGLFQLDRAGPFYFISGTPDHCRNGQRLIVEVMGPHHHGSHSPPSFAAPPDYLAPSPQPSSGGLVLATLSSELVVLITTFVALVWCAP